MNNNNNTKMEYNLEESQKKKERQEKVDNAKKKIGEFFDRLKEEKEERKRAKEEEARVKAQEKAEQSISFSTTPPAKHHSNGGFSEATITNSTISTPTVIKKTKPVLTEQEKRRRARRRRKILRNIMTIPEIIGIIYLALFLKDKYMDYSKDVHQVLNYSAGNYQYEIHRDNQAIVVQKKVRQSCQNDPCDFATVSEYEINFGKNQMTALRVFMDLEFKFKSQTKSIGIQDVKTEYGKKCIYALIHNNDYFLGFTAYNKYSMMDFEQRGSYTQKGYKYDFDSGQKILSISMGEKPSSGYALVVNCIYKKGDDLYVFVQDQEPESGENVSTIITHPLIKLQLEESPKNIYVYDLESGEEYPNLDSPVLPRVQNRKIINGSVGDLVGALRDEALKD